MDREQREPKSLVNMRTHLTVLTLAVSQLRRRHGKTDDIERLCAFADAAIQQLKADITDVEAMLFQSENREESRMAHLRLRQSVNAESYSQETGPIALGRPSRPASAARPAASSTSGNPPNPLPPSR